MDAFDYIQSDDFACAWEEEELLLAEMAEEDFEVLPLDEIDDLEDDFEADPDYLPDFWFDNSGEF